MTVEKSLDPENWVKLVPHENCCRCGTFCWTNHVVTIIDKFDNYVVKIKQYDIKIEEGHFDQYLLCCRECQNDISLQDNDRFISFYDFLELLDPDPLE